PGCLRAPPRRRGGDLQGHQKLDLGDRRHRVLRVLGALLSRRGHARVAVAAFRLPGAPRTTAWHKLPWPVAVPATASRVQAFGRIRTMNLANAARWVFTTSRVGWSVNASVSLSNLLAELPMNTSG